ncbi:hypothetical protein [Aeromonas veronii]|uniref:hypothetical protein n=1 Tax=Aeromonas veronii TaxID=654 RepID=UPI001116AACC|nr:hypothetical protein [Aeromonas veronii]
MNSITMDRSEVSGRRAISEEQDEEGSEWQSGTIRGGAWLATTATEEVEVLNCGQKKSPSEWGLSLQLKLISQLQLRIWWSLLGSNQ